jgi:hypothetical protein
MYATHPTLFSFAMDKSVTTELDRIGAAVSCLRLCPSEPDHAFGLRLAITIQHSINDREELLAMVLSLSQSTSRGNTKSVANEGH